MARKHNSRYEVETVINRRPVSQDCAEVDADAFHSMNEERWLAGVTKWSVRNKGADLALR